MLVLALTSSTALVSRTHGSPVDVVPVPAEIHLGGGQLAITRDFSVALTGQSDERLRAAVVRSLRRWEQRTGLTFARTAAGPLAFATDAAQATLVIDCKAASPAIPQLGDDESYSLEVTPAQIVLRAPKTVGALRGLETLLQLLQSDADHWFVPILAIRDQPRFPWRGLMIDVCRHWQPIEVIKRNLDGMALAKLNVFHFHLTEDQGFRVESKKYPRLHEFGSDGLYFTQEQIREIVAYAAARGIRVVPEFDIPGHATSWVVGHPEFASGPGPFVIERTWGVFDPTLDPTNEKVYEMLDGLFGEMAALFPDPYFHIGGDENNGVQWSANPRIQEFIKAHDLKDNHGLQAHFNRRLQEILARHGKKLVGWDEILHPAIPQSAVIHSWRGAQGLADATRAGHAVILSNGYYIDLIESTERHYLNDPLPPDTSLNAEEQSRVLGGEATMWTEWVTPETIDSRIWPRTAAIAERLWSPREITDVDDLHRRLVFASRRLSELGLLHETNRDFLLRRYAGDRATPAALAALRDLVALVEPVKGYNRGRAQPGTTQHTPLTGLADCAQPDSAPARDFARAADAVILGTARPASLAPYFTRWQSMATLLQSHALETGPRSAEISRLATQLAEAAGIGAALLQQGATPAPAWGQETLTRLAEVAKPQAAVELPVVASLRLVVVALIEQSKRDTLTPQAWREHVRQIAFPPATK
jgi:hexosaminidase